VVRANALSQWVGQDQARNALRRVRCEEGSASARAEEGGQSRSVDPDRVHDGEDVVGLLLDGRHIGQPVRQPHASALHHDERGEPGAPFDVVVLVRVHPGEVEMLDRFHAGDHGDGPVADHLIGQRRPVALDVLRGRRVHVRQPRVSRPVVPQCCHRTLWSRVGRWGA
jgi:hypothetical protein